MTYFPLTFRSTDSKITAHSFLIELAGWVINIFRWRRNLSFIQVDHDVESDTMRWKISEYFGLFSHATKYYRDESQTVEDKERTDLQTSYLEYKIIWVDFSTRQKYSHSRWNSCPSFKWRIKWKMNQNSARHWWEIPRVGNDLVAEPSISTIPTRSTNFK